MSISCCTSRQTDFHLPESPFSLSIVRFVDLALELPPRLDGGDFARRFSPLRESAHNSSRADFSLMFVSQNFGSPQSGVLCIAPSICGRDFLLISPAQMGHFPESPFMRFELIVVFVVRLWNPNSCNIQDVGLVEL